MEEPCLRGGASTSVEEPYLRGVRLQPDLDRAPGLLRSERVPRHPEHLRTFDYLGPYRYSLRFCTESRQRRFTEAPPVELVLKHFLQQAEEEGFALLAYCFMPDHVHWLVEGLREK